MQLGYHHRVTRRPGRDIQNRECMRVFINHLRGNLLRAYFTEDAVHELVMSRIEKGILQYRDQDREKDHDDCDGDDLQTVSFFFALLAHVAGISSNKMPYEPHQQGQDNYETC